MAALVAAAILLNREPPDPVALGQEMRQQLKQGDTAAAKTTLLQAEKAAAARQEPLPQEFLGLRVDLLEAQTLAPPTPAAGPAADPETPKPKPPDIRQSFSTVLLLRAEAAQTGVATDADWNFLLDYFEAALATRTMTTPADALLTKLLPLRQASDPDDPRLPKLRAWQQLTRWHTVGRMPELADSDYKAIGADLLAAAGFADLLSDLPEAAAQQRRDGIARWRAAMAQATLDDNTRAMMATLMRWVEPGQTPKAAHAHFKDVVAAAAAAPAADPYTYRALSEICQIDTRPVLTADGRITSRGRLAALDIRLDPAAAQSPLSTVRRAGLDANVTDLRRLAAMEPVFFDTLAVTEVARLEARQQLLHILLAEPTLARGQEEVDALIADLQAAGSLPPRRQAIIQARLAFNRGDYHGCARMLDGIEPPGVDSRFFQGWALLRAGELGPARRFLRATFDLTTINTPEKTLAALELATAECDQGRFAAAAAIVAATQLPEHPLGRAISHRVAIARAAASPMPITANEADTLMAAGLQGDLLADERLLQALLQKPDLPAAVEWLRRAPLSQARAPLATRWRLTGGDDATLQGWCEATVRDMPEGPGREVLAGWLRDGRLEQVIAGAALVTAARDADPDLATARVLARLAPDAPQFAMLLRQLATRSSDSADALHLQFDAACRNRDFAAADALVNRLAAHKDPAAGLAYARLAVLRGNVESAADRLTELAAADPWNGEIWDRLGKARNLLGQLEPAAAAWEKAIDLRPDNRAAAYRLAMIYRELKRADDEKRVLTALRETVRSVPELAAILLAGAHSTAERLTVLGTLTRDFPQVAELHQRHAQMLLLAGRPAEAVPAAEALVNLQPSVLAGHLLLARARVGSGAAEEADTAVAALAAGRSGTFAVGEWLALADYWSWRGQPTAADDARRRAAERASDADDLARLVNRSLQSGRYADTIVFCQRLAELRPTGAALVIAGHCHLELGDDAAAAAVLAELKKRVPPPPGLALLEARSMAAGGDPAAAQAILTAALAQAPRDPWLLLSSARLQRATHPAAARQILSGLVRSNPNFQPARLALADMLLAEGSHEAARTVLSGGQDGISSRLQEATLLLQRNDAVAAAEVLDALLQDCPTQTAALRLRCDAAAQLGDYAAIHRSMTALSKLVPDDLAVRNNLAHASAHLGHGAKAVELAADCLARAQAAKLPAAVLAALEDTLAFAETCVGDYAAAIPRYRRLHTAAPAPATALPLAEALLLNGQDADAAALLEPLLQTIAPAEQPELHLTLLALASRTRLAERLITAIGERLVNDVDAEARARLLAIQGTAQAAAGGLEQGRASLRRSLAIEPKRVDTLVRLAIVSRDSADIAAAELALTDSPNAIAAAWLHRRPAP